MQEGEAQEERDAIGAGMWEELRCFWTTELSALVRINLEPVSQGPNYPFKSPNNA